MGPQYSVPDREEGLGVIVFCALELMVDIMIGSIILKQVLEDVIR